MTDKLIDDLGNAATLTGTERVEVEQGTSGTQPTLKTTTQAIANLRTLSVTDGSATVSNATEIDFTSGATVTDGGAGVAQVAVSGGSGPVQSVTVALTANQINHLNSAPPTIIAAPGAGEILVPISFIFNTKFGTTQFSLSTGQPVFKIGTNSLGTTSVIAGLEQTSDWTSTADFSAVTTSSSSLSNQPLTLSCSTEPINFGVIASSTLGNNAGLGYAPGDTGEVDQAGSDFNALYVIDTVGAGGAVLTYHLTNAGSSYSVGNNSPTSTTSGAGNGALTLDVTGVTPGDGSASVTILYTIKTLP